MGRFLAGLILGLLVIPVGVCVYFITGMVPVATSAEAMPFEKTLARMGLRAHVAREAPKSAPFQADDAAYAAAAQLYRADCAVCHGLPNRPETPVAKGMFPQPPQLFAGHGVTDDPPGETYWKIANGIRLTGMPAYSQSLSDQQMWQIALLLATERDKLPEAVKQELAKPPAAEGVTQPANPASANPADLANPAPPSVKK
ncbi:MAG: cytochrome c [Acidobacteriota bacterium]|nr:cytochrome c [Acidobacteriota bacterium]